jgi:hypothetical protein
LELLKCGVVAGVYIQREYVREMTQVVRFIEKHFGEEASEARLGGIR